MQRSSRCAGASGPYSLLIEEMNAAIKASDPTVIINDNAPDPTRALKDRG